MRLRETPACSSHGPVARVGVASRKYGFAYHGTTASIARAALTEGLLPRSVSGAPGNWAETPSRADHIYLTTLYAPYFAQAASRGSHEFGIVEVDLSCLSPDNLFPDEDYIEQVYRNEIIRGTGITDLSERTVLVRDHLERFQSRWAESMERLGNLSHREPIPPEAITRVSIVDATLCTHTWRSWPWIPRSLC